MAERRVVVEWPEEIDVQVTTKDLRPEAVKFKSGEQTSCWDEAFCTYASAASSAA